MYCSLHLHFKFYCWYLTEFIYQLPTYKSLQVDEYLYISASTLLCTVHAIKSIEERQREKLHKRRCYFFVIFIFWALKTIYL